MIDHRHQHLASTPYANGPTWIMNEADRSDDCLPSGDHSATDAVASRSTAARSQENRSGKWNKTLVNFWLDLLMLVAFVGLLWTSVIVRFVFPPAITAENWTLWGWNVDQWINLQFNLIAFFTFLVVVHLMLHWNWVCGVVASRFFSRSQGRKPTVDNGTQTLWGVGLLIVLLNVMGVGVGLAVLSLQRPF